MFILLAVRDPNIQAKLLTWIFVMRILMIISSVSSATFVNEGITKTRYADAAKLNFEAPLTQLVWITSIVSVIFTFIASALLLPDLAGDATQWWKLSAIMRANARGRHHPGARQGLHVDRERARP